MRGIIKGGAVLIVAGGLVLGASGLAGAVSTKPKSQSTAKYAKTVCGVYAQLAADTTNLATFLGTLDSGNPTTYAPAATAQTNALLATVKTDEATLKGAYPSISNGKKVGSLMASRPTAIDSVLTTALGELQAGGIAGVTQFTVGITTLPVKVGDPFTKLTDQGLIGAFQKEKTCRSIVQVTGGTGG